MKNFITTKKGVLVLLGTIVIIVAVYGILSRQSNVVENVENTTPAKSEYTFNGEGRQFLGPVNLEKGLVLLEAKNQDGINSYFSVNVYADTNGNGTLEEGEGYTDGHISVGYEDAEAFDGTTAFKSNGGGYFIEVEGGRWQITFIESKKLTEQAAAPTSFSGKSINVTEKFYLPAVEYSFRATNEGEGNFIIYMVDEDGNFTKRLVNEIGAFDGDFSADVVFDGNYIFAVQGGDNWTITRN